MDIDIRPVPAEGYEDLLATLSAAFSEEMSPVDSELFRPIFDTGRTWGAYDDADLVGVAADTDFELTVPGGMVPVSGVHTVGVKPTHRRRGIMRALLRRQTDEARASGQALSYLWASEGPIYQRVGYGMGTLSGAFKIDRQHTGFLRPVEPGGRLRLVAREEALKIMPTVYDRVRATRPGMVSQTDAWWQEIFRHSDHHEKSSPLFFAIHESAEGADGYVAYRVKDNWDEAGPDQTLTVEDLLATTDQTSQALWAYCFGVDLVRHVEGWKRPVDEPLLLMLAEPRALRFKIRDGAWLRVIDLSPALEARRYSTEGTLRLEVRDEFCPWNEGRWELHGGPDGATCRRSDGEPDVVLAAGDLAAMYLGAVRPSALARAGRVQERTDGALERADAMFAWDPAPWCPHVF